jgi:glutathione gamma-glutamylcysteinyltransferase
MSSDSPEKKILPQQAQETSSFYKRTLPSSCISFTSKLGKDYFKQALDENNMESYFPLAMQFLTQSEPAFCGLGTLAMVLNALEIDPMRKWKGVWRWFDETMLDCCRPLEDIKKQGITLSEFTCLARCNGLHAVSYRADDTTKEQFYQDIKRTSKIDNVYLCVSFARKTLDQTGETL